ncbi:MAG: 30S ribosomal protein S13 [Candidatus Iainarchaeum archaeon]|uniref:30S ribosomal protein S13 n=1 Tax=Candidatus Iainarchaeum sp. TaxID=3101447 RepID=A0A497JHD9_9ARCH|nr:MAG: 30S ribosomal protein S13 [Candidatus Diapherotrites archaeon]
MAEIKYIVRVAGKDLSGIYPLERALRGIKGISHSLARVIALVFERETGVPYDIKLGKLDEKQVKKLEDIILHPENYSIPGWLLNRQKDPESGKTMHLVMGDLDFALRKDKQRLSKIKSYRGLRLMLGLPVRGQRTKSSFRKGPVVGVSKKEK